MVDHATPDVGIAWGKERAGGHYFLLADISGYTGFLNGVERAHLVDLSGVSSTSSTAGPPCVSERAVMLTCMVPRSTSFTGC